MKLLIIRHGPAGDRVSWKAEGKDDRLRPLTPEGKRDMRLAVAGLAKVVKQIDILASSPLTRALQSAEIVAAEFGCDVVTVPALEPQRDPEELMQWLKHQRPDATVAAVGHEPHQSTLMGYLLTGKRASFVTLKKAGTAALEIPHAPKPGAATLEWLLPPRALRRLAK